jgi:small subunit ribosomal protein S7
MARRNRIPQREVLPDFMFQSKVITKLINGIMIDGKKAKAEKILYGAFDIIKQKTNEEPIEIFNKALTNIIPEIEVRTRRIGGANYQIPTEVSGRRKQTLALR